MAPLAAPAFVLPSQRVEPYEEVEKRIQAAVTAIQARSDQYVNIAQVARNYEIPITRLRAGLQGRQSKQEHQGANSKLSEDQELAVCQYLDRLDTIGTCARPQMVSSCANAILAYGHTSSDPAS